MPKPLPPEPVIPPLTRLRWRLRDYLTWPWDIRKLKRAGFRRVGWMTWEYDGSQRGGSGDD